MKIICTQENLKAGLLTAGRIISTSNTLPILNNILIKTENGVLKISSTNLEIAVSTEIRCKIEEEGEVTVLSKTITDLVNNLPNKNINLETKGVELYIETENYHTSVKTLPAEEFPLIPQLEGVDGIELDSQELKNSIDEVVFATSTNQTQPEISGVLFSLDQEGLTLVATDRYRLAEKKIFLKKNSLNPIHAIIPQKTMSELSRIIGGQSGMVGVMVNETQISFTVNQTTIISRVIDGQYPPYKEIIPQEFTTTILINKQQFVNALKASGIFSQNSNSVTLRYDSAAQELTVSAESQDLGNSVIKLPSDIKGGDGLLILNYHYILDCLSSIDTASVVFKITNDSSPSILVPEGKNDYMYLVMPIKS